MKQSFFLPINQSDLQKRNIKQLDIIIITGDAYIDHPSFGPILIARYLESKGYKTGLIAQPNINTDKDFLKLGVPKLYFGISAGNMDSMINRYTAQKKLRTSDAYSPDGNINLRPDRAVIKYGQKIKKLFKNVPIILGGIEASLRRIPHYDYWTDKIRNSILFDAQADMIIYGMGERQSCKIAQELETKKIAQINDVPGTVVKVNKIFDNENFELLPEYKTNYTSKEFREMSNFFEKHYHHNILYQKFGGKLLKHNLPDKPLSQNELDEIYDLPFIREPHPVYKNSRITAFEQIKLSITSHRGCFGGCNFCAIGYHQGKTIQSRSHQSISREINIIKNKDYFHGTISDIGGPSSNMYGMKCQLEISETCKRNSCIYPDICKNLDHSHNKIKNLLKKFRKDPDLKNIFITSGIRFDLALNDEDYIKLLAKHHTSGLLKLAPEHKSDNVLKYMNKPEFSLYQDFVKKFSFYSKLFNKKQTIVPYIIVGHPGSTLNDTIELAIFLKKNGIKLSQIQEFTPTPMTASTLMYYTGLDSNGNKIHIPKGREIKLQKALVQWFKPENKKYVIEALKLADRKSLINFFI